MSGKRIELFIGVKEETVQFREGTKKLIEETPSPVLTDTQRKDLLEKTVRWLNK